MEKKSLTYREAGVDVNEGARAVQLMRKHIQRTLNPNVLCDIGGFGGLFQLDLERYKNPVLVSGTDGVGTKLKIAFLMDKHDTVGQDCVAMCVNDVLCQGAKPLFFLDYVATGKLKPEKIADIVKGIADGCVQAGCALIGGETAEMPGFYAEGEYDLAGFAVGIVDREKIIDGSQIAEGDVLIGLPSSGIHSNGYSLVRKLFFENLGYSVEKPFGDSGKTLGEILLEPTRIYVKPCMALMEKYQIKGMVHITGGGFYENIPRVIPQGLRAVIELGTWPILPIFETIQELGNIEQDEMFSTLNMGIGMILVVNEQDGENIIRDLEANGEKAYRIGQIVSGDHGVEICPR